MQLLDDTGPLVKNPPANVRADSVSGNKDPSRRPANNDMNKRSKKIHELINEDDCTA